MRKTTLLLTLIIAGFLLYSHILFSPFVYDDLNNIVDNPAVRSLSDPGAMWRGQQTRFIPLYSFALNYAAGGLHPFGYHLINLILHVLGAFLVARLAVRLLRAPAGSRVVSAERVPAAAAAAGLLFLCHPLQTQAVTYVVQRITLLASLFYLASVVSYLKARQGGGTRCYILAGAAGLAAMLSKETAFTLPFALLLIEWIFFAGGRRPDAAAAKRLAPFALLLAVIPVLLHFGIGEGRGLAGVTRETTEISRPVYALTQMRVLVTYLRLLIYPSGQSLVYDFPLASWPPGPGTIAAAVVLVVLFGLAVRGRRRRPLLAFAVLWFFLTLSVESSFVPLANAIDEHRMYLPLAGIAIGVSTAAAGRLPVKTFRMAVIGVLLVLALFTIGRNDQWRSAETLWTDVIRKAPNREEGYTNLGYALAGQGDYRRALPLFEQARRLDPDEPKTLDNLATAHLFLGDDAAALRLFRELQERHPRYPKVHFNLGLLYLRRGEYATAIRHYEQARRAAPDNLAVRRELCEALVGAGRAKSVRSCFENLP